MKFKKGDKVIAKYSKLSPVWQAGTNPNDPIFKTDGIITHCPNKEICVVNYKQRGNKTLFNSWLILVESGQNHPYTKIFI
jgi:hypothetical protein